MRNKTVVSLALLYMSVFARDFDGQVKYLPDHISKAHPFELRTPLLTHSLMDTYGATAAETNAINQAMQRIADFLLAQPVVNPPRGFSTNGHMRIIPSPLCQKMPCRNVPIPGWIEMRFYNCIEDKGKPFCGGEWGNAIEVYINDPKPPQHLIEGQQLINDLGGPQVLLEPRNHREVHGLEVYEGEGGEFYYFVLTRSTQPFFLPISQEIYLPWLIKYWENKEAELLAESRKKHPEADDANYRNWLAQRGERMRQAKAHCESLKKNGLEKDTDKCLRDAEKMEEETGKNIQMAIATGKETESRLAAGIISESLPDVRKILERLRMQQAHMTPAERKSQAYWDSGLFSSDDPKGRPLAMVNPAIIDRTLPRTSIQLIQVRFENDLSDRAEESKFKHADGWGFLNLQKTTHWEELRELLAK